MAKRKKDAEDQNENLNENNGGEDNFGLPDIEYKPLDEIKPEPEPEPEQQPVEEPAAATTYEESPRVTESTFSGYNSEEESKTPVIIGLVIVLVVAVSGYLIYEFVYKPQAEKEKKEQLARENEKKKKEEEARLAREREEEERKRREAEEAAKATPASGEIVSLTEKTGRYYVVIASAVDGDLVMDYAKKLSEKGTGSKIIPPFGKWKYFRLAISDHDTFANAQTVADQSKAQYGEATWVIKY